MSLKFRSFTFDFVLFVGVLPSFIGVEQFLVQWPIRQFEILHTIIDIAVFPAPILSSADVVQHLFIDLAVVKHLPRVVLDDSVLLCVSHTITHLASKHLLLLPLPNVLTGPQELDLLPGKIGITVPSVFEKLRSAQSPRLSGLRPRHYSQNF